MVPHCPAEGPLERLPRAGVVIPAAGSGTRMGRVAKPFLELAGQPVLLRALRPFLGHPRVEGVVVALAPEWFRSPPAWLAALVGPRLSLVEGGETRTASVLAALEALPAGVDLVAVHDAARPLVDPDIFDRCLAAVGPGRGAVAGWPAVDTLKEVGEGGRILATPCRERFWHAQTPQVFPRDLLLSAYREAVREGRSGTDDAALVEEMGGEVVMVEGSPWNLKLTWPEDLRVAELLLKLKEGAG